MKIHATSVEIKFNEGILNISIPSVKHHQVKVDLTEDKTSECLEYWLEIENTTIQINFRSNSNMPVLPAMPTAPAAPVTTADDFDIPESSSNYTDADRLTAHNQGITLKQARDLRMRSGG